MALRGALLCFTVFASILLTSSYKIDPSQVTVGGLSSGGFLAVQLHVAYSSVFKGAAIFAAGPFYCAQDSEKIATHACMSTPSEINVQSLINLTSKFNQTGEVDDVSNLDNQPVFVYSGTGDTIVHPQVVHDLVSYYQLVAKNVSILSQFSIKSEHCLPTLGYGEICDLLSAPYVGKCNYDGAGAALNHLYPNLNPAATNFVQSNLHTQTNQLSFVPKGSTNDGLASDYFVYVPSSCQAGNVTCKLHISLHGCNQNYLAVSDAYYAHAGFNTWAETNGIIVAYPQAKAFFTKPLGGNSANPEGCFDWWGYTGTNYAAKTGAQMATVMNIVSYLSQPSTILN